MFVLVEGILRWTNILLLVAFIVNLLLRFRVARRSAFYVIWLSFWMSWLIQYVFFFLMPTWSQAILLLDYSHFLNSYFLLFAAELIAMTFTSIGSNPNKRPLIKWIVPCVAVLIALPFMSLKISGIVLGIIAFLSMAMFAGRILTVYPKSGYWVSLLLYLYAGITLLFPYIIASEGYDSFFVLAATAVTVPLKVILFYTGYKILLLIASHTTPSNSGSFLTRQQLLPNAELTPLPEPTITIQFTGLWGFLFLLWRQPSGKTVALLILASLIAATLFIVSNLGTLIRYSLDVISR